MALPAYAEAVRFYDMALQALERQQPVDDVQRCTLLLALGEAQTKAGDFLQASNTFQRTANIARTLGASEALARAALGFQEARWRPGLPGEPAVRLLEEALYLQRSQFELLKNPCVIYDGASPYSVEQKG